MVTDFLATARQSLDVPPSPDFPIKQYLAGLTVVEAIPDRVEVVEILTVLGIMDDRETVLRAKHPRGSRR